MTWTAEQLKLARQIVKSMHIYPPDAVSDGRCDRMAEMHAALVAISMTTERAAKLADYARSVRLKNRDEAKARKARQEARDYESMSIEAMHIASALRDNLHLKGTIDDQGN